MRNRIVHLYLLVALAVLVTCQPAEAGILKKLFKAGKIVVGAPVVVTKAVAVCTFNYARDVATETGVGLVDLVYYTLGK